MNDIYLSTEGNIVMRSAQSSLMAGFVPSHRKVIKVSNEILPLVKPIPLQKWREVVGFMLWTQQHFKGESQVCGYIHGTTGEWNILPLFQEEMGMQTKETTGPENDALRQSLRDAGYGEVVFTLHHHCNASAFQSGGDKEDEWKNKPSGFHITLGHLDKPVMDIHVRAKFAVPGEFDPETGEILSKGSAVMGPFNMLRLIDTGIPESLIDCQDPLRKELVSHLLLKAEHHPFPEEWKGRISKHTYTHTPAYVTHHSYVGGGGYSASAHAIPSSAPIDEKDFYYIINQAAYHIQNESSQDVVKADMEDQVAQQMLSVEETWIIRNLVNGNSPSNRFWDSLKFHLFESMVQIEDQETFGFAEECYRQNKAEEFIRAFDPDMSVALSRLKSGINSEIQRAYDACFKESKSIIEMTLAEMELHDGFTLDDQEMTELEMEREIERHYEQVAQQG